MIVYLDASVLVSIVTLDVNSEKAGRWYDGLVAPVIISDLANLEVCAVISREFRARRFTRASADKAYRTSTRCALRASVGATHTKISRSPIGSSEIFRRARLPMLASGKRQERRRRAAPVRRQARRSGAAQGVEVAGLG